MWLANVFIYKDYVSENKCYSASLRTEHFASNFSASTENVRFESLMLRPSLFFYTESTKHQAQFADRTCQPKWDSLSTEKTLSRLACFLNVAEKNSE